MDEHHGILVKLGKTRHIHPHAVTCTAWESKTSHKLIIFIAWQCASARLQINMLV